MEYVQATTLPEGEKHAQRDAVMRANHAAGRNALEGDFEHMLDDHRTVLVISDCLFNKLPQDPYRFGYDAMDDADEWWINWGRFRDTGRTNVPINLSQALISSVTTCVENNDGNAEEAEEK
jgi:salicylate hydroxylase